MSGNRISRGAYRFAYHEIDPLIARLVCVLNLESGGGDFFIVMFGQTFVYRTTRQAEAFLAGSGVSGSTRSHESRRDRL
jgi:hypothetical protein